MERLKPKLKEISGIGDAKADEIIQIFQEETHASNNVRKAIDHLKAGYPEQALEFLEEEV